MPDRVKLTEAQEYLTMLNRSIARDEHETQERVSRCSGLDGDADLVSCQEWQAHHERCAALRAERDALIKVIVANLPMPTITIPAGRALLASNAKTGELP